MTDGNGNSHRSRPVGGQGQRVNQGDRFNDGSRSPNGNAAERITAPYNFVPLSRFVFFPDWSDRVSHDVPFADGISGSIECELVAESPLYVRNGGYWEREDILRKPETQSFFKVGKQFVIPGTSLKGMLRNVVEIVSFGKIGRRVVDNRYGVRDLRNRKLYTDHMTMTVPGGAYRPQPKAAWLSRDPETREWRLTPCESCRVEHSDLKGFHSGPIELRRRQDVTEKYSAWKIPLRVSFDCEPTEMPHRHQQGRITLLYRKVQGPLGKGGHAGTIVFTGQPGPSKHMEFIFFNDEEKSHPVPKKVWEEFLFIHSDSDGTPNREWGFWERKVKAGERVPVFFKGTPDKIESFGLALMYRLPYQFSIRQAVGHTSSDHFHPDLDLAETIFGCLPDGKDDGLAKLKGRVSILPAVAVAGTVKERSLVTTVLGAPKPTYYPNYVKQAESKDGTIAGNYKSYMDGDGEIRGWKRYPARPDDKLVPPPTPPTEKVCTKFVPLEEGATFAVRIRVHNLLPAELGAVLWALDWGGNAGMRHSLGMGKSLGFGQVRITLGECKLNRIVGGAYDPALARAAFVELMNREFKGEWLKTEQMEQLLAMSNCAETPQCGLLQHMTLEPNQFVAAKGDRDNPKKVLLPHVPRTARKDEERFQGRKSRPLMPSKPGIGYMATATSPAGSPDLVDGIVVWADAQLGFSRGSRLLTARSDGKQAEVALLGEMSGLVSDELLKRLNNGKPVAATVSVLPCGGGRFRVVAVKAG